MGRRPLQRTLPGLNPSLLVAALPPRLESGISFLYYAAFGPAPGLSSLLPWPFTGYGIDPFHHSSNRCGWISCRYSFNICRANPWSDFSPVLELTAASSIASAEQESLLIRPVMPYARLWKPIHPRQGERQLNKTMRIREELWLD